MSTPIENNTEELQNILETVNNLPNLGGNDYDLVFVLNLPGEKFMNGTPTQEDISDVIGDYATVKAKIQNGEKVNAILKYECCSEVVGWDDAVTIKSTVTPTMITLGSGAFYGREAIVADFVFNTVPGMPTFTYLAQAWLDNLGTVFFNCEKLSVATGV